ncbi:Pimeloyl-ACP methyl ester carboxylesterase [Streptomyces sp. WMMB 714]|uniref:alpha/beta fold hydrolase n=1 Tax=Streptomyces sp. WMMB 714 TaxID=1286822 RepID=UPI0005F87A29|nr:alpha/beta hydrolase [Streptomyces sp. WMMB 714]SCK56062.1 Pimeloyl-ACP methyl ester carboxylesterase [Streptomyces sp. WMMB 714]
MTGTEIELPVDGGVLSGLDFGGGGRNVLLVHGSGQNAAAWTDVATRLADRCHPVAVDLRGHGQTRLASTGPEQYWQDIGSVVAALSWERPLLVGHSSGGYAVTAAAACGLLEPAALCLVDGMVLNDRGTALAWHAAARTAEAADRLRTRFRYGWETGEEQMQAYVGRCVRDAADDPLNAGARPGLVGAVARRSFLRRGGRWVRQPTVEEIAAVSDVGQCAHAFPSNDVYERVTCPVTVVLADGGSYAARRDEVRAVVDAAPGRRLVELASNHNVPMTKPAELAAVVLGLLEDGVRQA